MEDLQKELTEWLGTVTVAIEDFFEEVGQAAEEMATEIEADFVADVEAFLEDIFDDITDFTELDNIIISSDFADNTDDILSPKIDPTFNVHPACIGCRNYHGRIYNNNLLVCGMHPYGWDGSDCPDWERH